jgi:drug/metabolite transporter (DMT)-like permease
MLSNYYKRTPKKLLRIMLAVKGIVLTASGSAYMSDHPNWAFWMLIAGAVLDELTKLFTDENDYNTDTADNDGH